MFFRICGDEIRKFERWDVVLKAGAFSNGSGYFSVKFGIEIKKKELSWLNLIFGTNRLPRAGVVGSNGLNAKCPFYD